MVACQQYFVCKCLTNRVLTGTKQQRYFQYFMFAVFSTFKPNSLSQLSGGLVVSMTTHAHNISKWNYMLFSLHHNIILLF